MIDDIAHGNLLPYETLEVEVSPGPHRARIVSEEDSSRELSVNVTREKKIRLRVTSRPGAAWFNPLLIGRAVHLRLSIVESD
jgi:hypothetical protein